MVNGLATGKLNKSFLAQLISTIMERFKDQEILIFVSKKIINNAVMAHTHCSGQRLEQLVQSTDVTSQHFMAFFRRPTSIKILKRL